MTRIGPRVSVVIATYNRADSLARLLAALDAESRSRLAEVVVVDDGSTDRTHEVIASQGVRRVVTRHGGPAAARNAGWRAAAGDLIVFTDDDCVPAPGWLEGLIAPLCRDPSIEGVGGEIVPLVHGFIEDFASAERLAGHGVTEEGDVRYLVTANAAFRRSALERSGGFDESFAHPAGEDVDLSVRILAHGGRLVLATRAMVAHDYRSGLRSLFRTYWRHGAARRTLAARHAAMAGGMAARRALSPPAIAERYKRYRAVAPRWRALTYMVLRVLCLTVFAAGMLTPASVEASA